MRRARKTLVAFLVLSAATLLILWNTAAQEAPQAIGVSEAKRRAALLEDTPLSVRGIVVEGSIVTNGSVVESFAIEDSEEQLLVLLGQVPPDGFGPKDVVVNGRLRLMDDGLVVLEAESLQVGCASKY